MTVPELQRLNHGRNHSYKIGGAKPPSITGVLRDGIPKPQFGRADVRRAAKYAVDYWDDLAEIPVSERLDRIVAAPQQALSRAGARGTHVHSFAQRLAAGEEVDVPDELDGYVRAYLRFIEEWQPQEIHVERPVFNVTCFYAGTPDLFALLADDQTWILDWKTTASGIWPETALQLAAARYAEWLLAADGTVVAVPAVDAAGGIHLCDDGSYELVPCEAGLDAFKTFLNAKQVAAFTASQRDDWVGYSLTPPVLEAR